MSWHATPFEERLEKALSEESLISQRYVMFCGLNRREMNKFPFGGLISHC